MLIEALKEESIYLLRIVVAGLCGIFLGAERSRRLKEAGIRTHFVVACGSALMMAVSISFQTDQARIAAQVVSGIGFLGAGMIFFRREALHGLTTAAGIWATAGIGMAAGAGLYLVAIGSSLIIFIVQLIFHSSRLKEYNNQEMLLIKFEYSAQLKQEIETFFGIKELARFKINTVDSMNAEAVIRPQKNCTVEKICDFIAEHDKVKAIERMEDL